MAGRTLILPGLNGSGPNHWQSHWERSFGYERVEQADWERPTLAAWLERLEACVAREREPVTLVAHSLGCALALHFAMKAPTAIAAALLVAPADVEDPLCTPDVTRDFAPLPRARLGFTSCVVASRDDPYVLLARAREFARAWGSSFHDAGALGHINAESNLGDWPYGQRLLAALRNG